MARLYSYETDEVLTLPDEEVNSLILSGSHSFLKGDKVHIRDEKGSVYEIPAEDGFEAIRDGFVFAGAKDVELAKLKAYVRKKPGTAFALGALRSLSFAFSDKLLLEAGVSPETLKAYRDENRFSNVTGEVSGLLSRFTPVGAGMAIGKTFAKSALKGKIKSKVAGDVAEGAIAASPIAISESILNEKPNLSSEQILAGAGFNLLSNNIGRLIGKGTGVLGEKGKSLADYLYFRSIGARTPEYNKLTKFGMNRNRNG